MAYKFEGLEIYQLALDYLDLIYSLAEHLPRIEEYNLKPQIIRAATSILLNIAEGSTSQSNAEQSRFLRMALRSLIETVACRQIIERRKYVEKLQIKETYEVSEKLFAKIQAMRRAMEKPANKGSLKNGGLRSSVSGRIHDE
jgi:four helix bundle protein